MPEEPEIELERVHESIHEPPSGSLLRGIALSTALFAALGAVAALYAGDTVNEALVLKTEAARIQAEASDQWNYYQAKGIKGAVQEGVAASWAASGKPVPQKVEDTIARYANEQKEIDKAAREKEKERDEKSAEADRLLEKHHKFANSVAMIQVTIALSAVAALTRIRIIWIVSLLLGLAGAAMFTFAMMAK
jgi:hypothetical protein